MSREEADVPERSARELSRVDALFHLYVAPQLATSLERQPERARLGGEEREVSVLFADLAGFTGFSEDRPASEVVEMLNRYWAAALAIRSEADRLAADHSSWPRFRIAVNTGPAMVGNVGADLQRSFTVIGDTINLAAPAAGHPRPPARSSSGPRRGRTSATRQRWSRWDLRS